jgi:hypothetical protein
MSGVGEEMSPTEGSRLTSLSEPGLHVDRQRSIDFAKFPAFPAHRKNSLRARIFPARSLREFILHEALIPRRRLTPAPAASSS